MKIQIDQRQVARPSSVNAPRQNLAAVGIADGARAELYSNIGAQAAELTDQIRKARVSAEVSNRLAAAQREHAEFWIERSSQPDGFKTLITDNGKALRTIRDKALQGLDDADGQAMLSERLQQFSLDKGINAASVARKQEIDYSDNQTRLAMENNRVNMSNTTSPQEFDRLRNETRAALDAQVAGGVYSKPIADAHWADFVTKTQTDAMQRLVLAEPYAARKLLRSDEPIEGIDGHTRAVLTRQADAEINRIDAAREESIRLTVQDANYALERGFVPPNLDQVMKAARGTKYEAELGRNKAILEKSAEFALLPPADQASVISTLRSQDELSGVQARYLDRIETVHDKQKQRLKDDPAGLSAEIGLIPAQKPLNFGDPAQLSEGLQTAKANYEIQRKHWGDEQAGPLLQADVLYLQQYLRDAPSDDKAMALGILAQELDTAMPAAMRQLYDTGAVLPALAGEILASGDPNAAKLILTGSKAIEAKKDILPTGAEFKAGIQAQIGGAYQASPKHWAAVTDGIVAAYAGLSQLEGDFTGTLNEVRLERAVQSVTGGLVEFNGQQLQPPARNIDSERFSGWVTGLRAFDLERMGGIANYENKAGLEFLQDLLDDNKTQLVSVGNGRYQVFTVGLTGQPAPLLSKDRDKRGNLKRFELDWFNKATHHTPVDE